MQALQLPAAAGPIFDDSGYPDEHFEEWVNRTE
jgi:hypothetical protein